MSPTFGIALSLLAASAAAQQIGQVTPEVHPKLPTQYCTKEGCETRETTVVLDAQYRWTHTVGGEVDCKLASGALDPELCPDVETCAETCAVEGADYESYGIITEGDALTLKLYTSSPRVYLLDANEEEYVDFKLLNREFTYDVDASLLPCGVNGALYFSEMAADGDKSELNKAGAAYGTGYCDAQCPKNTWVAGEANIDSKYGACCNEMDIWEANSLVTAYTPHPCNATETRACSGAECEEVCDSPGCDFNAYRMGQQDFYGPNKTVDSTKPITVVTQFYTEDNKDDGALLSIERLYVQNGKVIENIHVNVDGFPEEYNYLDDEYCDIEADVFNSGDGYVFAKLGGMTEMGNALGRGMVLAMSIWSADNGGMLWLDGNTGDVSLPGNLRGPCTADQEQAEYIEENYPDAAVVFSNIKWGEIGTTFSES
ncbi:hypothetical protein FQN54_009191 [Arachnomyces sp. PD_36]|nr:hypothetical protein FQN54_009191 [Arachnomyces sp. PD_36]